MGWKDRAIPADAQGAEGWKGRAVPADGAPAAPAQSPVETGATQLGQVLTGGNLDELAGAIGAGKEVNPAAQNPIESLISAGAAKLFGSKAPGGQDLTERYRQIRDKARQIEKQGEKDNPTAAKIGTGLGIAGSAAAVPATLAGMVGYGALSGLGNSEADLTRGQYGKAALDTGVGATLGAAAHGLGSLVGGVGKWALGKSNAADAALAEQAARQAAKETTGARNAAGRTAQDTYRTLEHIRDLAHAGSEDAKAALKRLEDSGVIAKLEGELFGKSVEKLPASMAAKEAAAQTLQETASTEGERAADIYNQKTDVMGALKPILNAGGRYAKRAVVGGVLGGIGGELAGGHGQGGAAAGALGLNVALAPTLQKAFMQPSVQRMVWGAAGKLFGGAGQAVEKSAVPVATNSVSNFTSEYAFPRLRSALGFDDDEKRKQELAAQ